MFVYFIIHFRMNNHSSAMKNDIHKVNVSCTFLQLVTCRWISQWLAVWWNLLQSFIFLDRGGGAHLHREIKEGAQRCTKKVPSSICSFSSERFSCGTCCERPQPETNGEPVPKEVDGPVQYKAVSYVNFSILHYQSLERVTWKGLQNRLTHFIIGLSFFHHGTRQYAFGHPQWYPMKAMALSSTEALMATWAEPGLLGIWQNMVPLHIFRPCRGLMPLETPFPCWEIGESDDSEPSYEIICEIICKAYYFSQ